MRPLQQRADLTPIARLRAAVVGATGAGTGILAHALGHGSLPGIGGLLVVLATGVGLGLVAVGDPAAPRTASRTFLLALLAGGQVLVHLLLIALTGHHQQLITGPMALVHTVGTLVAFGLIVTAESLAIAAAGRVRQVYALCTSGPTVEQNPAIAIPAPIRAPQRLRQLGTVGTRGPPVLV